MSSIQCFSSYQKCDGVQDCVTAYDETGCEHKGYALYEINPPAVIHFVQNGMFTIIPLPENNTQCPETHFQCQDDGYCLPVYVRCNDMIDCPGHEDEADCENYKTCPGFYRCRDSDKTICLHVNHLCDGLSQCPRHDDERMCFKPCPTSSCVCYGFTLICNHDLFIRLYPDTRYFDVSNSAMGINDASNNIMLVHLGVRACGLKQLSNIVLPNLHSLDLSHNLLQSINFSQFAGIPLLRRLNLAGNPMHRSIDIQSQYVHQSLLIFNISYVQSHFLNMSSLSALMPNLQNLDLSWSDIRELQEQGLFHSIRFFNLQGCTITHFTPEFMKRMSNLMNVSADNFKLCCSVVLPDNFRGQCLAPSDEISSCDDLLKSSGYRYALVIFAVFAVLGNFCGFVYRTLLLSENTKTGFAIFVIHLCVSDHLMGVYLIFIGVADRIYAGIYLWNDTVWKTSSACIVAGFLSLLSSEVSAFIIFLITLDRFLVLHFPFSQIRFGVRSAHTACVMMWILGLMLATVPLLPITSHWQFYQQTGICIPLPVTRADFPGHIYSFSIMIVCNLILFLLIGIGQIFIYLSVRSNTMSNQLTKTKQVGTTTSQSTEGAIAMRLLSVAVSDFLCWFPVGICGVLAASGVAISGEVNVAMAIFVLPLNAAFNPFLYTLNIFLEKRRLAKELRFLKMLQSQEKK